MATPLKVHYDSLIFSRQRFGGISKYIVELINHLPEDVDYSLSLSVSDNHYLKDLRRPQRHLNLGWMPEQGKINRYINRRADLKALKRDDFDILHPTDYNPYFLGHTSRPYVITVHDMIHEIFRSTFGPKDWVCDWIRTTVENATRVIAISHSTKRDLHKIYGIPEERIDVVHHGVNDLFLNHPAISGATPEERYLLFVGQRGGHKNFGKFLEAFATLSEKRGDLKLICTGQPFSADENRRISKLGLSGKVKSTFVDEKELPGLYASAEAFVFPSLYEGFGMPILEAFAAGCPVALSDASCFPEIAGEGGAYFSPEDPEEMATVIAEIVDNPEKAAALREAGKERLKSFSWEKTARLTVDTYRRALRERSGMRR